MINMLTGTGPAIGSWTRKPISIRYPIDPGLVLVVMIEWLSILNGLDYGIVGIYFNNLFLFYIIILIGYENPHYYHILLLLFLLLL